MKKGEGIEPISLENVKGCSLKERPSKVGLDSMAKPWKLGGLFKEWLEALPKSLAARDLLEVAAAIKEAVTQKGAILLGMGAHPIKVGLSTIIIQLIEQGVLSGIAMNGACIIHDAELAMAGKTSEDVATALSDGSFGMAEETGQFLNKAAREAVRRKWGLGKTVGALMKEEKFPYNDYSILAKAYELEVPVTVHVAIGTDIIHCQPSMSGEAVGESSHLDFRIFCTLVSKLERGVFINLGSAVIIPEVFLKAISVARNLGYNLKDFVTVNMDFVKQYRPLTNVVHRPTMEGGKGYNLVGHHEIMFPLLCAAVLELLWGENNKGR